MAIEMVRGEFNQDISAETEGVVEIRTGKRVIDDEQQIMVMCQSCHSLDINEMEQGIGWGLHPDHAGRGTKRLLIRSYTPGRNITGFDLIAFPGAFKDAVGISVEVVASNNMVPCTQQTKHRTFCSHGRRKGQRVCPVFQGS